MTNAPAVPAARLIDPAPVSARGANGAVTVDGDWVTIRKGLVRRSYGVRGARRIPVGDIAAVHLRPATDHARGYLQIVPAHDPPARNGLLSPTTDEHTVTFGPESAASFERVRGRLQAALDARSAGANGRVGL